MVDGNETASDSDSDWHVAFTDFRSVADAHFACTYRHRHRHRHPNAHEPGTGPWSLAHSVLCPVPCPSFSGSTWRILRRWHVRATTTSNAMHSRQVLRPAAAVYSSTRFACFQPRVVLAGSCSAPPTRSSDAPPELLLLLPVCH